jgi:nickel transport protein
MALAAGPAAAHETFHEVRQGAAIAVRAWESDGEPLARVPFEVYSPAEPGSAWTTGRTDRDGWLAFVPDRPGRWRVRVIEAAGHGIDVGVEALAPPAAPPAGAAPDLSSAASPQADRPASPGASYLVRLVLGLAVLGAVFAALVLARRKRDARDP